MTNNKSAQPKEVAEQPGNIPEVLAGQFSVNELPKSFLEAWLLLLLKTWGAHGYALVELLNRVGFSSVDHTRIYRQLRSMEQRGLVSSKWDVGSNGPAKRVYMLTAAGEDFLSASAQILQGYSKMLDAFGSIYGSGLQSLFRWQTGGSRDVSKKGGNHGND